MSGAVAAQTPLLGVNMHPLQDAYASVGPDRALGAAAGIGAAIVRIDIYWSDFETTGPGTAGWNPARLHRLDQFLAVAKRRGIQVIAAVLGTPCWEVEDRRGCAAENLAPRRPQDYTAFLTRLIRHAGDAIQYYEIWNEPNISRFWAHPDPARYTALLKSAYRAVKRANPALTVLAGATSHADLAFLRGMYQAGAKGSFDALSIHPYTDGGSSSLCALPAPSFACGIERVARLMERNADVPSIWLTEFGVPATAVPEMRQAVYLARTFRQVRRLPYVRGAIWYQLFDSMDSYESGFGLFRSDLSPRPAAGAFASAAGVRIVLADA